MEEVVAAHDHVEVKEPAAAPVPEAGQGNEDGHAASPYFNDPSVHPHEDQAHEQVPIQEPPQASGPKITRQTPPERKDPSERYKDAKADSANHDAWGTGEGGYKVPNSPSERMRYVVLLLTDVEVLTKSSSGKMYRTK